MYSNNQNSLYPINGRSIETIDRLTRCKPSVFSLWIETEIVERVLAWNLYSNPNYVSSAAVSCLLSNEYFYQMEDILAKYEEEAEDDSESFINIINVIQVPYDSIADHIIMAYVVENQELAHSGLKNFIKNGSQIDIAKPDRIMETFSGSSYYRSGSYREYNDLAVIFESCSTERKKLEKNKIKNPTVDLKPYNSGERYTKEDNGKTRDIVFDNNYSENYDYSEIMLLNSYTQDSLSIITIRDAALHSIMHITTDYFPEENNIYKGKILEACLSEKFFYVLCDETYVGALHFDEVVDSGIYNKELDEIEWHYSIIEERVDVGDEFLVQAHEDRELSQNGKNTFLTTFLTIIGLYIVLLPNNARMRGISQEIIPIHRIAAREKLKKLLIPNGFGFIIRSAGALVAVDNIQQEINDLLTEWDFIRFATKHIPSPALVYEQRSTLPHVLLELLKHSAKEIIVNNLTLYRLLREYCRKKTPEYFNKLSLYNMEESAESVLGIDAEILELGSRDVDLVSGGSLTFDYCESVVFIDVNGSKSEESPSMVIEHYEEDFVEERNFRKKEKKDHLLQCRFFYRRTSPTILESFSISQDKEENRISEEDRKMEICFAINMEAATEIARQIRLRDLGGIIVLDFVEVYGNDFMFAIENRFRDSIEHDQTRIHIGSMSRFGLMEVIRQKTSRQERDIFRSNCKFCYGVGKLPDLEFVADLILQSIQNLFENEYIPIITIYVSPTISTYILEGKSNVLKNIEVCFECAVNIVCDGNLKYFQYCIQVRNRFHRGISSESFS